MLLFIPCKTSLRFKYLKNAFIEYSAKIYINRVKYYTIKNEYILTFSI